MIRVLNIISDTNIGGAGRVILNYLRYTDKSRFETMVAIPRGSLLKKPLEEIGAEVYEVDGLMDRSFHKDDVKTLRALVRQVKPDLFHPHGVGNGIHCCFAPLCERLDLGRFTVVKALKV